MEAELVALWYSSELYNIARKEGLMHFMRGLYISHLGSSVVNTSECQTKNYVDVHVFITFWIFGSDVAVLFHC